MQKLAQASLVIEDEVKEGPVIVLSVAESAKQPKAVLVVDAEEVGGIYMTDNALPEPQISASFPVHGMLHQVAAEEVGAVSEQ